MRIVLPDYLPGRLLLTRGRAKDYSDLQQFHYIPRRPATWADIWAIRYIEPEMLRKELPDAQATPPLGVQVSACMSADSKTADSKTADYDSFNSGTEGTCRLKPARRKNARPQERTIGRTVAVGVLSYPVPSCGARERFFGLPGDRANNLVFANANLRTISRVIVHPQFRSLGLSTILVRCLCENSKTRYVEAIAQMARAHPFFDRAGMHKIPPRNMDEPVYYIWDRMKDEE